MPEVLVALVQSARDPQGKCGCEVRLPRLQPSASVHPRSNTPVGRYLRYRLPATCIANNGVMLKIGPSWLGVSYTKWVPHVARRPVVVCPACCLPCSVHPPAAPCCFLHDTSRAVPCTVAFHLAVPHGQGYQGTLPCGLHVHAAAASHASLRLCACSLPLASTSLLPMPPRNVYLSYRLNCRGDVRLEPQFANKVCAGNLCAVACPCSAFHCHFPPYRTALSGLGPTGG